jgi:hypothetical protein
VLLHSALAPFHYRTLFGETRFFPLSTDKVSPRARISDQVSKHNCSARSPTAAVGSLGSVGDLRPTENSGSGLSRLGEVQIRIGPPPSPIPILLQELAREGRGFPSTQAVLNAGRLGDLFDPLSLQSDQARSKRSRFITLFHAATKSCRNFSWESSYP